MECDMSMEFREVGAMTEAVVRLRTADGTELLAQGRADRAPHDPAQPRVGADIAAARALDALAHRLLARAGGKIEEITHARPRLEL